VIDLNFLQSLFSLEGRAALVTGASGGIGAELAVGLAKAGAKVALNGRSVERLEETRKRIADASGESIVVPAEISDLDACREVVERTHTAFGRLDILVNCAGMNHRQPVVEVQPETYDEIMAANLRGPYFLSQAAFPHLRESGGSILHIGSLTVTVGLATVSVYGMTKAALAQLTRTQAIEWAEHGVRVNCLCPGFIVTPLTENGLWDNEQKRKWMLDRIPFKRGGRPEEMVGMALYLVSPASSYMTGQTVYLDGGMLAGSQW
jgi:NAD(P)-dependent dehydrogenase (short-subunit alcohol dehydrogenase family)